MARSTFARLAVLLCVAALPWKAAAQGANYPDRPISLIVTFAPGGSTDVVARVLANEMKNHLGQPMTVLNRPGAGGVVGWDAARRAAPDGYTLVVTNGALSGAVALVKAMDFDPVTSFTHIAMLVEGPLAIATGKDFPARTFGEFLAQTKANPGKFNYAVQGGNVDLDTAMLIDKAGLNMVAIPYKGGGPAIAALIANEVHLLLASPASLQSYAASGQIRILGIASDQAWPEAPELPVVGKESVPGYAGAVAWFGISAPPNVPREIVAKLNTAFRAVMNSPEIQKRLAEFGLYRSEDASPEAVARMLKKQTDHYVLAAKISGKKPE